MNKIILHNSFNGKNKYFIIVISLLIVALFFLALPYDSEYYELYFFTEQYVETYSNIILELFKIIMPIGIIIITFEHDASFIRVLSTKLGRDKIISFKQLNYNLIVIITYLMLNALYLLILSLTGYYILFDPKLLIGLFYLFLDILILLQLVLLFCNEQRKLFAFLILIIYLLLNFFYELYPYQIFYFVLPVYSNYFTNYTHITLYKILYIGLLYFLNIIVNRKINYD